MIYRSNTYMIEIAAAFLVRPDGKYVFQRRTNDAFINPGRLGLFGGHVEKDETDSAAVRRELAEETSLDVAKLEFKSLGHFDLEPSITGHDEVRFHLYKAYVPSSNFKVYEGAGAEVYSREEILQRSDLSPTIRHLLNMEPGD